MNGYVYQWLVENIELAEVVGKNVLEVGSRNINGSIKPFVSKLRPNEYVGVDFIPGKGVDIVLDASNLLEEFKENSFDVVISTEMLEHVNSWRAVIHNLKMMVKPKGVLILTTRSIGFGYHSFPYDFWRYEITDFQEIFKDFEILKLESDITEPGVFLKARKPEKYLENSLSSYQLYSVVTRKRELTMPSQFSLRSKLRITFEYRLKPHLNRIINGLIGT